MGVFADDVSYPFKRMIEHDHFLHIELSNFEFFTRRNAFEIPVSGDVLSCNSSIYGILELNFDPVA